MEEEVVATEREREILWSRNGGLKGVGLGEGYFRHFGPNKDVVEPCTIWAQTMVLRVWVCVGIIWISLGQVIMRPKHLNLGLNQWFKGVESCSVTTRCSSGDTTHFFKYCTTIEFTLLFDTRFDREFFKEAWPRHLKT